MRGKIRIEIAGASVELADGRGGPQYAESMKATVESFEVDPSPATHAILIQLKAGDLMHSV